MSNLKRIAVLAALCFASVAYAAPAAKAKPAAKASGKSEACIACHETTTPGIIQHWKGSSHAKKNVGCFDCHQAEKGDADAFEHNGALIATVVTPRDCGKCHKQESSEFGGSHHARAGNILASLDNYIAENVEGTRETMNAMSATPGRPDLRANPNGLASAQTGCQQCHGAKVGLVAKDGGIITKDDLKPGPDGKPTNQAAVDRIARKDGKVQLATGTWPNTGIGRLNLDGSLGSCSACHSRHDFSARRARQPENCGKCHLGPDHPQKEIFDESKHGIAFYDARANLKLGLDKKNWVLGKDYTAAPSCASCHMSANVNGGKVSHDIGARISWTNRPPISLVMDTDKDHKVITDTDPEKRKAATADTAMQKRARMQQACAVCHSEPYVQSFYKQYDDAVQLYNEKFAKPGAKIMATLRANNLITKKDFDEEIEWSWYYLWHHEGRRARHGASMMAPDYAHWHGFFEVAEDFYMKMVPQAQEIIAHAAANGQKAQADAAAAVLNDILARPEHQWFMQEKAARQAAAGGAAHKAPAAK